MIARVASRATVAKKSHLSLQEAQMLINRVMQCEKPDFCPYGKPTVVKMSLEEIALYFSKGSLC